MKLKSNFATFAPNSSLSTPDFARSAISAEYLSVIDSINWSSNSLIDETGSLDTIYDLETKEVLQFDLSNQQAVLVPDNYAHGFITLEDDTIVTYLVRGEYNPDSEHSIVWDTIPEIEETINELINDSELVISDKDLVGK